MCVKTRKSIIKCLKTNTPSDGGNICAPTALTVQSSRRSAAQELLPEVFAEAFAHQVEGERVHTGVGEGQNASTHAGDEVAQRGVHLVIVVGAVQVDDMTWQPADGKQAHKHKHRFGQTLSGLDLKGESREEASVSTDKQNCSICMICRVLGVKVINLLSLLSSTTYVNS